MIKTGIDIGSTTVKVIATDETGRILYSRYERHNAKAGDVLSSLLKELLSRLGDQDTSIKITGSVGMGFAEKYSLPFIQEVVAAAKAIQKHYPHTASMIDIGGEDAKIVFFKDGKPADLRMNGNCAGGTGAFIDQMAVLLGVDLKELNALALHAANLYPIASRCGVFCKTDIQNLIAKNVSRKDIAASILHAVAVQTVITLAHGHEIRRPVLFCGGPLTFIPALRKAFADYLSVEEKDIILPADGTLLPALGAALSCEGNDKTQKLSAITALLDTARENPFHIRHSLPAIFTNREEYQGWQQRISRHPVKTAELTEGRQDVFIGIDSGSTTTKIIVTDADANIIYSYYSANEGNPIGAAEKGLKNLQALCSERHATLNIKGGCSTGYGEDLIKAAFRLNGGIVETIAHYTAARHLDPDVSFILDIGGQDMKAIFVKDGVIDRIEINEACSSGCGSFIETFAKTLGYTPDDFSSAACLSASPCNLGTRCTVFMNSKVKQALREGATVNDIAAGLAYSVVKNCLYKVLKLKDTAALGARIAVQGGTMRNDAVVRALELLSGAEVTRSSMPELMGAFGCALYARRNPDAASVSLEDMLAKAHYTSHFLHCKGCDNQCLVVRYQFDNGEKYYSGNRCEKVFTNGKPGHTEKGTNTYEYKNGLLFRRHTPIQNPRLTIGIPRSLNMYEEYPFWHTLFTSCGIQVCLPDVSSFSSYEKSACMVMSDNICFPAKLVHSHIRNLQEKQVDRIFLPFVVFEKQDKEQNSYNCPIVTGYSEVIKSVQHSQIPIDSPAISFKDKGLLYRQCHEYLSSLHVAGPAIRKAFNSALQAQDNYVRELIEYNENVCREARKKRMPAVLLAGRPYHTDALIQHRVSNMLADMGIHVITDDIVRDKNIAVTDVHFLPQWAYPNRILKAAGWCASQTDIQFIEMTSFGCGPDAFLVDEVRDLLMRHNKVLTILKLDDINNIGSMKLRVRSLVESLRISGKEKTGQGKTKAFKTTPAFTDKSRRRKILVPYFTSFISPLIPAVMKVSGYDVENLPLSNAESCDWGLKYANNEVCYPATLIVGDVIKAFKSGKYNPDETAIAMTQTGGQCRASNYVALIKKALTDAGYTDVPVVSLDLGNSIQNQQPGFKLDWAKLFPLAIRAILYSDCIAKFYYASAVREKQPGQAARLRDLYLQTGADLILEGKSNDLLSCLAPAAGEFNRICAPVSCPKVGIVGKIFLKFNPFAQKDITGWLIERKIEIIPPLLLDFFLQGFVNRQVNEKSYLQKKSLADVLYRLAYRKIKRLTEKVNKTAGSFRHFIPFGDIFEEAEEARKVITLNAQFGEGWLLPAEVMSCARRGVNDVISLQPFGCIANHIVSKGIEKRIKDFYPDMNILSLDFDSGVSDVNITNRLLLFIDNLKKQEETLRP